MSAMKVKIHGAGSIGNHLAHASRRLGWKVDVCDIDPRALGRMKNEIYPSRYQAWDDEIGLYESSDAPCGGYDLIFVGTPPDSHMELALTALAEQPRALLVEKPLCTPDLADCQKLKEVAAERNIPVFVGYDHVVGTASRQVEEALSRNRLGPILSIDVEFREHWGGIFAAHPWLSGPQESYLGYWRKGGGASGEHSHALNLWQHFAHLCGAKRVVEISAAMDFVKDGSLDYDRLALFNVKTETGLLGRVVQDVITMPARKWGRVQGQNGFVEWHAGYQPGCDAVLFKEGTQNLLESKVAKTRPDDFILELKHIEEAVLKNAAASSPISLQRGLDTMLVVAAAHLSVQTGRTIRIDYAKGACPEALGFAK